MPVQGLDPCRWRVSDPETIRRFFARQAKHVVYFGGYGELGYEKAGIVREVALDVLRRWSPDDLIVLTGTLLRVGGHDGIAEVYQVAKEIGIRSAGIHPSVAQRFAATHRVSPLCDDVFFVDDETWGGFDGAGGISPTLQTHLDVADELVVIGGGKHAADELRAFVERGRRVRYFAAEMNRASTVAWFTRVGIAVPDLRGAANGVWQTLAARR